MAQSTMFIKNVSKHWTNTKGQNTPVDIEDVPVLGHNYTIKIGEVAEVSDEVGGVLLERYDGLLSEYTPSEGEEEINSGPWPRTMLPDHLRKKDLVDIAKRRGVPESEVTDKSRLELLDHLNSDEAPVSAF